MKKLNKMNNSKRDYKIDEELAEDFTDLYLETTSLEDLRQDRILNDVIQMEEE